MDRIFIHLAQCFEFGRESVGYSYHLPAHPPAILSFKVSLLIVACWLHAIRKRGMSNPSPFFMVFIINFNVLKVYDKKTERFVKG